MKRLLSILAVLLSTGPIFAADSPRQAALDGIKQAAAYPSRYGFKSAAAAQSAVLGPEMPIYTVDQAAIAGPLYSRNAPEPKRGPFSAFAVLANGKVRAMIRVRQTNGQWWMVAWEDYSADPAYVSGLSKQLSANPSVKFSWLEIPELGESYLWVPRVALPGGLVYLFKSQHFPTGRWVSLKDALDGLQSSAQLALYLAQKK